MSERIVPAKNGLRTLFKNETALHSRYDPVQEAEKYINSLSLEGRDYSRFILVEPGLGYMAAVLKKKFPAAIVVVLHCSAFFSSKEYLDAVLNICGQGYVSWDPDSETGLEDFLEEALSGSEPAQIRIIEWRPAALAYGKELIGILERTVDLVKRLSANRTTVRKFGRRWLRNMLRNLDIVRRGVRPVRVQQAIVVCASGPSLEKDLPLFAGMKKRPLFMAVSSSVPCLVSSGIVPDMVIGTDGGPWAAFHIIENFRGYSAMPLFVFALSASAPSQAGGYPLLFLADGTFLQQYLLRSLNVPFLAFPQRGTVSASALDLAFFLTDGPVYVSGFDFRHNDLLTHSRPYALDRIREEKADRLRPAYSQAFEREGQIQASGALAVYDSWLRLEIPKYPKRLYALERNNVLGIPYAGEAWPGKNVYGAQAFYEENGMVDKTAVNAAAASACLIKGLNDPLAEKQLSAELGGLLFPDGDGITTADIEHELLAMDV